MRSFLRYSCLAAFALVGAPQARAELPPITAALASLDRPAVDRALDNARHPAELLRFAGVKPGDSVADIIPGKGYFTRLFSKLVGANGRVYAVLPLELIKAEPHAVLDIAVVTQALAFNNVAAVKSPLGTLDVPHQVDVAWTSDNYHDLFNNLPTHTMADFNRAVFRMVRPGGEYIVVDYVAKSDTSISDNRVAHRIIPAIVKAQVEAAGLFYEESGYALNNPADGHTYPVFDPRIKGQVGQFAFRFRKPIG